jgi:hypothetical protein
MIRVVSVIVNQQVNFTALRTEAHYENQAANQGSNSSAE